MASTKGYAIGWDDEIIDPGEPEFVLLTPGIYDFTITGFERGHFARRWTLAPWPS